MRHSQQGQHGNPESASHLGGPKWPGPRAARVRVPSRKPLEAKGRSNAAGSESGPRPRARPGGTKEGTKERHGRIGYTASAVTCSLWHRSPMHAPRPRPPVSAALCIRNTESSGGPVDDWVPVDSSMPRFEASQSAIPCPHETPQQTLCASLPYTRKRHIDICVASTWRFSSPYLHIAKPSSFTSA